MYENNKPKGYYSGNENIIQTLVDCLYDSVILLGKTLKPAVKWLFDGWIEFDNTAKNNYVERNYEKFFTNSNIKMNNEIPILLEKGETNNYYYYLFDVPVGMCDVDFLDKLDRLSTLFNYDKENIRVINKDRKIEIELMKPREIYMYIPNIYTRDDFKIPLGYDKDNNLILLDLLISRNFGCYIAGSAGGGKSQTLRLILTHLINNMKKEDLELVLIDTKYVDLNVFKEDKHVIKYVKGTDYTVKVLQEQLKEMNRRYEILDKTTYDHIWEFREKGYHLPFRIVVIEEISAYQDNKEYQKIIKELSERGRAAGIFPICTCQFPNKDVLPSVTKSNYNTILGHKTVDALRSEVIAGKDSGLEKLRGDGNNKAFFSDYPGGVEYQSLYVTKDIIKHIINK